MKIKSVEFLENNKVVFECENKIKDLISKMENKKIIKKLKKMGYDVSKIDKPIITNIYTFNNLIRKVESK